MITDRTRARILIIYLLFTVIILTTSLVISHDQTNVAEQRVEEQIENFTQYKNDSEGIINSLNDTIKDLEKHIQDKEEIINGLNGEIGELNGRLSMRPSFNSEELNLFYRLVESEAGNDPIEGRIAVANVVLNRIASDRYPNNLYNVIYQPNQFEVVNIGTINTKIPSAETIEAVNSAINGEKVVADTILLFWATYLDPSNDLWDHCKIRLTIGGHHFSDKWN